MQTISGMISVNNEPNDIPLSTRITPGSSVKAIEMLLIKNKIRATHFMLLRKRRFLRAAFLATSDHLIIALGALSVAVAWDTRQVMDADNITLKYIAFIMFFGYWLSQIGYRYCRYTKRCHK